MSKSSDDPAWDELVAHFRRDAVAKIASSACTLSLVPGGEDPGDDFDVKFALELGASIMLGKPIVPVVIAGRSLPPGLAKVADAVIVMEHDFDTAAGELEFQAKLADVSRTLGLGLEL